MAEHRGKTAAGSCKCFCRATKISLSSIIVCQTKAHTSEETNNGFSYGERNLPVNNRAAGQKFLWAKRIRRKCLKPDRSLYFNFV